MWGVDQFRLILLGRRKNEIWGITDKKESLTELVIVTTGLVGWDNQAGLTNGHAYRYKIVASLTGKGDPSGDSRLSYSKVMYRLKTSAWKYVKKQVKITR